LERSAHRSDAEQGGDRQHHPHEAVGEIRPQESGHAQGDEDEGRADEEGDRQGGEHPEDGAQGDVLEDVEAAVEARQVLAQP